MSPSLMEIEQKALTLSPEDKELLIQHLIVSLEKTPISEIDQAWIEESEKRYNNYKLGITQGIPESKIFKDIRRELGRSK
jgi:putative addiction module component (TIGR02574 family)